MYLETHESLKNEGMKPHAIRAFLALQKLGIDVRTWHNDSRGHFWICCEGEKEETELHIDYWNKMWGSEKLNSILEKNDLYFEWLNPAVAEVWNA